MKASAKMLANSNAPSRDAESLPQRFEDLPNVGPRVAGDLRLLGLTHSRDLLGRDPLQMYRDLERLTESRQDPCVLDVFISITRFMDGEAPRAWWDYTAERKRMPGVAPRQRFGRERAALHGLDSLNCPTHAA